MQVIAGILRDFRKCGGETASMAEYRNVLVNVVDEKPVADGINMLPGIGDEGYVSVLPTVPTIVGASEDEMAPFDAEDEL